MWFDHSVPLDSACELCHSSLVNAELTPVKYAEGNTVSYQKDALIYKEMANRNQRFLGDNFSAKLDASQFLNQKFEKVYSSGHWLSPTIQPYICL
ncbi:uncharacterized protein LOC143836782 isoform X3 [Paroedura picta]|uniref:uncharacterized protein LOC143836782 isoform X3 n=1 Tax=Paroedura picta TaxID=143630 RepID=UPI004056E74C